jgi:hypothetical protein
MDRAGCHEVPTLPILAALAAILPSAAAAIPAPLHRVAEQVEFESKIYLKPFLSLYRLQGLKPGAFKIWVNLIHTTCTSPPRAPLDAQRGLTHSLLPGPQTVHSGVSSRAVAVQSYILEANFEIRISHFCISRLLG